MGHSIKIGDEKGDESLGGRAPETRKSKCKRSKIGGGARAPTGAGQAGPDPAGPELSGAKSGQNPGMSPTAWPAGEGVRLCASP